MVATVVPTSIRRHLLGASGLAMLAASLLLWWFGTSGSATTFWQASCLRGGMVLVAAWLAFPQLDRFPNVVLGPFVAFLLLVAFRPRIVPILVRYAVLLLPVFGAIWVLRRLQRKPPSRSTKG